VVRALGARLETSRETVDAVDVVSTGFSAVASRAMYVT
jgi:hypothetical protein